MIDKDRLIQTVVERHGFALSKDDPIFATLSIHEVILEQYFQQIKSALTDNSEALNAQGALLARQYADVAENLITKSILTMQKTIRAGVEEIQKAAPAVGGNAESENSSNSTDGSGRDDSLWLFLVGQMIITAGLLVGVIYCVWKLS